MKNYSLLATVLVVGFSVHAATEPVIKTPLDANIAQARKNLKKGQKKALDDMKVCERYRTDAFRTHNESLMMRHQSCQIAIDRNLGALMLKLGELYKQKDPETIASIEKPIKELEGKIKQQEKLCKDTTGGQKGSVCQRAAQNMKDFWGTARRARLIFRARL